MSEIPKSPEARNFGVTSLDQLLAEYNINVWPHVADTDEDRRMAQERVQSSQAEAERRIRENGGLTADELDELSFVRKGEMSRNDI